MACGWHGVRASCAVEAEDSLGRVRTEQIDGIRGAAYRTGSVVGVVTDARNKDAEALFGTRMIELGSQADAERLYAFVDDRTPATISVAEGAEHPRRGTFAWLFGLLAYAFVSRRARAVAKREPNV